MLINSISPELQKEVKIDFYEKYLKNVLFIKESVSNETLQKLCMVVKERKL